MSLSLRGLVAAALVLVALPSARAVTTVGSNFDGIMSLIYDPPTGGIFMENAPQPNPYVQHLQIASASNQFVPANLTLPPATPPLTVLSNTPALIDVLWSGGPFLGTGSSLGAILPTGLTQAFLLSDLTINFSPSAAPLVPGDLLYNTTGVTPMNPVLPSGGTGFWRFFNVNSGQFMDPPLATGYIYTMESASLFTKVGFPVGYGNNFTVTSSEGTVGSLPGGGQHVFTSGVSTFTITGISPAVDAGLPNAFPLYLEFSTAQASFNMLAIPVPEPATLALAGVMGLACAATRRRACS